MTNFESVTYFAYTLCLHSNISCLQFEISFIINLMPMEYHRYMHYMYTLGGKNIPFSVTDFFRERPVYALSFMLRNYHHKAKYAQSEAHPAWVIQLFIYFGPPPPPHFLTSVRSFAVKILTVTEHPQASKCKFLLGTNLTDDSQEYHHDPQNVP